MKKSLFIRNLIWFIAVLILFVCACFAIHYFSGDRYFDLRWSIVTGLIAAAPCLACGYAASAVFGIGSLTGYAISRQIILAQSPHITQKAGTVMLLAELLSFVLAVALQGLYCRLRHRINNKGK